MKKDNPGFLWTVFFVLLFFSPVAAGEGKSKPPSSETAAKLISINLDHINHLVEPVEIDGDSMAIIHVYSNYPDYGWVEAAGEGIAC
ncbi:MAG: hypothetical protein ACE5QV_06760, partial [Fidelibacterota bacterium]